MSFDKYEHAGLIIRIDVDEDPLHPREDSEPFGTMVGYHRNYNLGDKDTGYDYQRYGDWDEVSADIIRNEDAITLPVYLSSQDIAGQVGIIFISKAKVRAEYGWRRISKIRLAKIREHLENEIKVYDRYIAGDVWQYAIEDKDGEGLDSCGSFFGLDECKREAESQAEYWAEHRRIAADNLRRVQASPPCCVP